MNSFLKSKLQTAVVIFLTVSMFSGIGMSKTEPAPAKPNSKSLRKLANAPAAAPAVPAAAPTPAAPAAAATPASATTPNESSQYMPGKSEFQVRQETYRDCREENKSVADEDRELAIRNCVQSRLNSMDPARHEAQCTELNKKMNESLSKCPTQTCKEAVNACTGAADTESESLVNSLAMQFTGINFNPSRGGFVNCEITYTDYQSEKKDKRTTLEGVQKELGVLKNKMNEDEATLKENLQRIREQEIGLKKEQQDLVKAGKDRERKQFQELTKKQFDLENNVQQATLELNKAQSDLSDMINNQKKALINYRVDKIASSCRGELLKKKVDECSKNPKACSTQAVYTSLGSGFSSGGTRAADRRSEFDGCVQNTLASYSTELSKIQNTIAQMQAQIKAKNAAIARATEFQRKGEEALMQELEEMRSDQNQEVQNIAAKYQQLVVQTSDAQSNAAAKKMENLRQQMELQGRLGMATSEFYEVGVRPKRIGKDLTGNQAISEIKFQDDYRSEAERVGCCTSLNATTELCRESKAGKTAAERKSKGSSGKKATGHE